MSYRFDIQDCPLLPWILRIGFWGGCILMITSPLACILMACIGLSTLWRHPTPLAQQVRLSRGRWWWLDKEEWISAQPQGACWIGYRVVRVMLVSESGQQAVLWAHPWNCHDEDLRVIRRTLRTH